MRMMTGRVVRRLLLVGATLSLPAAGYAQDAAISGTVTDATGGVLPGVTITATHEASGNSFVAVSDERGTFRVPVRTGTLRISAELSGFAVTVRTVELLLGQTAVVSLQLSPSTVQESVTVTGEAPLIDVTSSTLGGNIDPRQMQELPVNGRNWMDLAMLAPGSRQNESSGAPTLRQGYAQINIDGQQVTTNFIGLGNDQPRFSRDVIAEFELITNRFDATQGRSVGMQVNAITKSGTNTPSGSLSGYFRDDKFIAADFIQDRVVPYSNQQVSTTFGGPIRRDRIHIFANAEFEREPLALTFDSPYPAFNIDVLKTRKQYTAGGKGDVQFSPRRRLSARIQQYDQTYYSGGGSTNHPSNTQYERRYTTQFLTTFSQVLGTRAVNEIKGGTSRYTRINEPITRWAGGNFPNADTYSFRTGTATRVQIRGYSFGGGNVQHHNQYKSSIRDDFTVSYNKGGRHDLRIGGEYIYDLSILRGCGSTCRPTLVAQNGAPSYTLLQQALPVWNDPSTWNLNLLAPFAQRYELGIVDPGTKAYYREIPQNMYAGWVQDDWTVNSRLTLNVGLRWDMETGIGAKLALPPILPGDNPEDKNNFAPRVGFAFSLNDRTVVRGGYGKFFAEGTADEYHQTQLFIMSIAPQVLYDGRPDFPTNPFNGPAPTLQQLLTNACDLNGSQPGCFRREFIPEMVDPFYETPYSHQGSIGVQRQLGVTASFESNYTYTGGRLEEGSKNVNLTYDPVTGANYDYRDINRRPMPEFGRIQLTAFQGWSDYHGWESAFTKRMSNRWQASATYTMAWFKDASASPFAHAIVNGRLTRQPLGFTVAPDLGGEYTLAGAGATGGGGDQRHRAVFNGIWEVGYGFQLSGLYFYGSGERRITSYGGDLRNEGAGSMNRLRPDGTVAPRNDLVGDPLHRVDLRIQRRFRLFGRAGVDGILEVFNVFNHENFGSYTTQESNASYGNPSFNNNIAYQPRSMQMGFRVVF
jgi:Carboxypeptidase regulatory-like domain/TonB dependent receptor-like, beta-barrel